MEKRYLSSEMISELLERQIETVDEIKEEREEEREEEERKRWIYLLSSATGSGKSYSIAHIMGKYAKNEGEGKKGKRFVYVVHTRENLHDVYQKLISQYPDIKDSVLLLKSEAEMIVEFFEQVERGKIDEEIIQSLDDLKSYAPLKAFIKKMVLKAENPAVAINDHRKMITQYTKDLKREIRSTYRYLQASRDKIKNADGTSKNKEKKKKINAEIRRLEKLAFVVFPTSNLEKYSIIFTTTHRFMRPMWGLKSSEKIYDMQIFKNQFLVMDEIDAQKKKILDILVESASEEVIDKISLFSSIHHTLTSSTFLPKYGVSKENVEEIVLFFDQVYKKYFNRFSFVYKPGEDNKEPRFLLRSDLAVAVEENIKRLIILREEEKHINYVTVGKKGEERKGAEEALFFEEMIYQIDLALARLSAMGSAIVIRTLAEKLKEGMEKDEWVDLEEVGRKRMEDFIYDLEFSPQDDTKKYKFLHESIMHNRRLFRTNRKKQLTTYAEGFYPKGFSIVEAISPDDDSGFERMRSGFRFYTLLDTPEYILQAVSARMFIIGISATATLKTVVNNFDFNYLRDTMVPVLSLSTDEIETLNTLYIKDNRQEHRPIHTSFTVSVDEDTSISYVCRKYFDGDSRAMVLLRSINDRLSLGSGTKPGKMSFQFGRYVKYMDLYWRFLTDTKITSFLVFVNKLPRNGVEDNMKDDLEKIFGMMIEANLKNPLLKKEAKELLERKKNYEGELFHVVDAAAKKHTYEEEVAKKVLSTNGMAFVFTTYETVGSGANLDYEVVMLNGKKRRRDYSAIYLERPTHIIPRGGDSDNYTAEMLRSIYFVHALFVSNDMSYSEFRMSLRHILNGKMRWIRYNENSEDFVNAVMLILIQAIGRCHRVNNPDDPLTIVADSDLLEILANFDSSSVALLPSVAKLLSFGRGLASSRTPEHNAAVITRQIERNSNRLARKIENLLKHIRTNEDYAREFTEFREHILRHPTKSTVEQNKFAILYSPPVRDRVYWYKTTDDFSSVEVILKRGNSQSWVEVSEESSGLPLVRKMPVLKRYFEEQGFATSFKHDCLLVPACFNNFYKGILGETIGSFLFRHEMGIEIEPLGFESGFFEFFDFVSPDGIYLDFKYYSTSTLLGTTEEEIRSHAARKLKEMGGERGMIVNIYYRGEPKNPSREVTYGDGIFIVPFIIDASNPEYPVVDEVVARKIKEIFNGR